MACGGGGAGDDAGDETDGDSDGPESGDGVVPEGEGVAPPAALKKLRSFEYESSVQQLFGDVAIAGPLPPDFVRASFSSIAAAADCYEDVALEDLETIALDVAAQAFAADPDPLAATGCAPADASAPCVRDFVASFGLHAWRRPLTDAELDKYVTLTDELTTLYQGDVRKGVELTTAALVQSPYFLYRVELGVALPDHPGTRKYTPYEMATRLSYTLWEMPPDDALLDAAAAGELATAASVREHAERMLADDRAIWPLFRFWREHLGVDRLTLTNYPRADADPALYAAMREEGRFLAYFQSLPGANALDFLTRSTAYLQPNLAQLYGIDLAEEAEVELPPQRRGFLTSGVFLVSNGHPGKTSPTRRGKFVLERVLCRSVPPPPADVDLELPDALPGEATGREILDQHSSDPSCKGCHQLVDPLGYPFESYGHLGAWRTEDNGLPVDASGALDGTELDGAVELAALLREAPDTSRCLTIQAFRSMTASVEGPDQRPYIEALTEAFVQSEHDMHALMAGLVSSDAFRFADGFAGATETPEGEE